jgi:glutathione-independent formaldehyde dehydrogenase
MTRSAGNTTTTPCAWMVSHELPLERAPKAHKRIDSGLEGWTKVVLTPQTS